MRYFSPGQGYKYTPECWRIMYTYRGKKAVDIRPSSAYEKNIQSCVYRACRIPHFYFLNLRSGKGEGIICVNKIWSGGLVGGYECIYEEKKH